MHEKINFRSVFISSFHFVTFNRISTCCYILQHYVPCEQWHNYKNLSLLSISYFRSSERSNIYYKTVFFCWSSHKSFSIKKGVLKSFAKSTGKHLCQSLFFDKVAALMAATLLKKRLLHRCFPVNFAKFLRTPFQRKPPDDCFYLFIEAAFET